MLFRYLHLTGKRAPYPNEFSRVRNTHNDRVPPEADKVEIEARQAFGKSHFRYIIQ